MFSVTLITVCELSTDWYPQVQQRQRELDTSPSSMHVVEQKPVSFRWRLKAWATDESGAGAGAGDGGGGDDGDGAVSTMDRDSLPLCLSPSVILSD